MTSPKKETTETWIRVGFVRKPHGIAGTLRVEPLTDRIERFAIGSSYKTENHGSTDFVIDEVTELPDGDVLLHFSAVVDRNAAEELRGTYLVIPENERAELGPDAWYVDDLLGMTVMLEDGTVLGTVHDVEEYVGNDVLYVTGGSTEYRIPMVRECIRDVDVEHRTVRVASWSITEGSEE